MASREERGKLAPPGSRDVPLVSARPVRAPLARSPAFTVPPIFPTKDVPERYAVHIWRANAYPAPAEAARCHCRSVWSYAREVQSAVHPSSTLPFACGVSAPGLVGRSHPVALRLQQLAKGRRYQSIPVRRWREHFARCGAATHTVGRPFARRSPPQRAAVRRQRVRGLRLRAARCRPRLRRWHPRPG